MAIRATVNARRGPDRGASSRPRGSEWSLHPGGADVLVVLDRLFAERADLRGAKLAIEGERGLVGQRDARKGDMDPLAFQALEQRAYSSLAMPLPTASAAQRIADLDRLAKGIVVAAATAARVPGKRADLVIGEDQGVDLGSEQVDVYGGGIMVRDTQVVKVRGIG